MNKKLLLHVIVFLITGGLIISGCTESSYAMVKSSLQRSMNPEISQDDVATQVRNNNEFAFDLYAKLLADPGNIFFSPFSISEALAMTYAGARGESESQMGSTLKFTLGQDLTHQSFNRINLDLEQQMAGSEHAKQDERFQLSIANSIWAQDDHPWLPDFLDSLMVNYGAGIFPVDFPSDPKAAESQINQWVEQQTNNKIKDLLKDVLDNMTRMVLVNAIYFLGTWQHEFEKESTSDKTFTLSSGDQINIPTMFQDEEFPYTEVENIQVVNLPYKNCDISMLVLLPKIGEMNSLEQLLNNDLLDRIDDSLEYRSVFLYLPKVDLESKFNLGGTLADMGMPHPFSMAADFSGMDGSQDLFISKVIHQAMVIIDEKGTEAAAATAVEIALKSAPMPQEPVEFKADHPFVIMIRDNQSGSILFLGRVNDPRG